MLGGNFNGARQHHFRQPRVMKHVEQMAYTLLVLLS
ncbi:Uncharacterised protein [Vibrio cholerae]|nr:Uncharacterised protein [Vibrio cholerae]